MISLSLSTFNECMSIAERETGMVNSFVSACYDFIESHAESCANSDGWLELPKHALVRLISSDNVIPQLSNPGLHHSYSDHCLLLFLWYQFALEEEQVWRAVLSWAKFNSGIAGDKHARQWSSQEKSLMAEVQ